VALGVALVVVVTLRFSAGVSVPTVFVSLSGNDSSCVRGDSSRPCASLARAYQLAQCGDTVEIAAGTYLQSSQPDLRDDPAKDNCGSYVKFTPAAGAAVSLSCTQGTDGCVAFVDGTENWTGSSPRGASWIELNGLTVNGDMWLAGSDHVRLVNVTGGGGVVRDVTNLAISGGSFGPCQSPGFTPRTTNCASNWMFDGSAISTVSIDGAAFHDFQIGQTHFECMFLNSVAQMTIQNSRFYNCDIYDIMIELAAAPPGGITIQNNWFGQATNGWAVNFSGGGSSSDSNVLIRYNSFGDGQAVSQSSGSLSNVRVIGNIFGTDASCLTGATYDFNVWKTGSCGSDSTTSSTMPYVNTGTGSAMDYHLASASSPFTNWITPTGSDYSLASDMDGRTRSTPGTAGSEQAP
jgi:hypothetical protein